jgi:hypothetical protein
MSEMFAMRIAKAGSAFEKVECPVPEPRAGVLVP